MSQRKIQLDAAWLKYLQVEFDSEYMQTLSAFLQDEKRSGQTIYPAGKDVFNALNSTRPEAVKVVVLGQDPYHGPNQAHGLSFSVPHGVDVPPSLKNIYKELTSDQVNFVQPQHGNLTAWAEQGVLLLNSVLTVRQAQAGSHQGKGWETFTDAVIRVINEHQQGVVFLFWGAHAQKKGQFIDRNKHLVLQGPHPSPLSAHRGFFGCQHFSQANQYLEAKGRGAINWQL